MIKCPFCAFDNEDGALFCEQCKSDLSAVAPSAPPPPEAPPLAAVVEEIPPMAAVFMDAPTVAEVPPLAAVMEAAPVEAAPPPPPPFAPEPPPPPPPVAVAEFAPPAAPVPAPAAPAPAAGDKAIPAGSAPKLIVIRGGKINMEFPIYPDLNFIGRSDEKPVDIDLEDQEPPDRVWTSRQHAVLQWDDAQGVLTLEDLNSANGTFVNRGRVHPGDKKQLFLGDVIQIGTVHLKVKI